MSNATIGVCASLGYHFGLRGNVHSSISDFQEGINTVAYPGGCLGVQTPPSGSKSIIFHWLIWFIIQLVVQCNHKV